jgi:hypothetical protein
MASKMGMVANGDLQKKWNEVVVADIKMLSWQLY